MPDELLAVAHEHAVFERAARHAAVHPFDDPHVIAGQGTVGLEILEDVPDVDAVVVPVGGGGLISGIATALKEQQPRVRVVGVEPEGAPSLTRALEAGRVVPLPTVQTMADGLAAPFAGPLTLDIGNKRQDKQRKCGDEAARDPLHTPIESSRSESGDQNRGNRHSRADTAE